jgi:3'(2'), 5'-bisphosphate nucleotidase
MAVVRGEADVYAHSGGQYEWDSAAPVAVAAAAGLHVSRLDGSPFRYNAANPWLPDLLICRPELAQLILGAHRPLSQPRLTTQREGSVMASPVRTANRPRLLT